MGINGYLKVAPKQRLCFEPIIDFKSLLQYLFANVNL